MGSFGRAPTLKMVRIRQEGRDISKFRIRSGDTKFLKISYDSIKWKKWVLENTKILDREKSIIAGHYVFSHPSVVEIKKEASDRLLSKNIKLNLLLKSAVKKSIIRYLKNFRIIN